MSARSAQTTARQNIIAKPFSRATHACASRQETCGIATAWWDVTRAAVVEEVTVAGTTPELSVQVIPVQDRTAKLFCEGESLAVREQGTCGTADVITKLNVKAP